MKRRLKHISRWHLEGYVLNAANRCGQDLISYQTSDHRAGAQRLKELLVWFEEDRAAIIAAARAGIVHLRELRVKWAAERAAQLKEAA